MIDLDSDGYFDLCKKNQNHCNPERFMVSKYGKNALAAGALPRAPLGELPALPQTHSWILGRKDGEKKRRERNVRKEVEGKRDKKEGEGNGGKDEEGTLLISFAPLPQPLNPGDATAANLTVSQPPDLT